MVTISNVGVAKKVAFTFNWKKGFCLTLILLITLVPYSARSENTAVLPNNIKIIEEQAFYGLAFLHEIILPEGIQEIHSQAFAYSGLTKVNLPSSLCSIADDAFAGCDQIVFHVQVNTPAHRWCITKGMNYVLRDELGNVIPTATPTPEPTPTPTPEPTPTPTPEPTPTPTPEPTPTPTPEPTPTPTPEPTPTPTPEPTPTPTPEPTPTPTPEPTPTPTPESTPTPTPEPTPTPTPEPTPTPTPEPTPTK